MTMSVCDAHDEGECNVETPDVGVGKVPDQLADPLPPDRNRLVGHHLRTDAQAIPFIRFDCHAKIRCIDDIGCHLANHDRWMGLGKSIGLYHDRRSRLPVITRRRDDNDITTFH